MKATRSIVPYRLEPLDERRLREIQLHMKSMDYTEGDVFGFRDVRLSDGSLSAILVKRTTTTIPRFDPETNALVDEEIFLYSETMFSLDSDYHLLEVLGSTAEASKVRASLRSFLGTEFTLSAVELAPATVVPQLAQHALRCLVLAMTIRNFRHSEGVVGRYDVKALDPQFVDEAMSTYGHDVTRATMYLSLADVADVEVTVSNSGRIRLTGDEGDLDGAYSCIKRALFGEKGRDHA